MSDIEKLFIAAYPLWPKQLLEKFSSLLSFEVAKFNPEINPQMIEQYKSLGVNQKIKIEPYTDNVSYLLSPSNGAKISQVYYGKDVLRVNWARLYSGGFVVFGPDLSGLKWYMGKVYFDTRIFKSVSVSISIDYQDNGSPYSFSYLSFMSYSSEFIQPVLASAYAVASVSMNDYAGAATVLAMIENGVSVGVDQKLLSEFVTFLNAYNKYGGELAAANSLQAEKNRQTMTDYKNSISEKLNSRKNELNDLRTQISFAAKNETASAKRDMQNLTLSAQSLMVQLQDKLK